MRHVFERGKATLLVLLTAAVIPLVSAGAEHQAGASDLSGETARVVAPDDHWLATLNAMRALGGTLDGAVPLPSLTTVDDQLSASAQLHVDYLASVPPSARQCTHETVPGYPPPPGDRHHNVLVCGMAKSVSHAIRLLTVAPYHGNILLDPDNLGVGAGYAVAADGYPFAAAAIVGGGDPVDPATWVWPKPGGTLPFTIWAGGETPNPLDICPSAPGHQSGPPLYVWAPTDSIGPTNWRVDAASLTDTTTGHLVHLCPIGSRLGSLTGAWDTGGGFFVMPNKPLIDGHQYQASIHLGEYHVTLAGSTWSASKIGDKEVDWPFSVDLPGNPPAPLPPPAPAPPARIPAGGELELDVAGHHGIPADAAAVTINLTATNPDNDGYLTIYPCGTTAPNASNVNYARGQTIPNLTITKIGANGKVCITSYATTDVIADLAGWYPATADYTPTPPLRILDTRL